MGRTKPNNCVQLQPVSMVVTRISVSAKQREFPTTCSLQICLSQHQDLQLHVQWRAKPEYDAKVAKEKKKRMDGEEKLSW